MYIKTTDNKKVRAMINLDSHTIMPVPGKPRAIAHRPDASPGRIPVPKSNQENIRGQIEAQKKDSVQYQLIKEYMASQGAPLEDEYVPEDVPEDEHNSAPITPNQENGATEVADRQPNTTKNDNQSERARKESSVDTEEPVRKADPLALDLDGNGIQTTGVNDYRLFDINGDGVTDRTSFIGGSDAFLAIDGNENGRIDSVHELFGDQSGYDNGFQSLARFDENRDGLIDASDSIFAQLRLFSIDDEGNQKLWHLEDEGIKSISLGYQNTQVALNAYDSIAQMGSFTRESGEEGVAADVWLGYR